MWGAILGYIAGNWGKRDDATPRGGSIGKIQPLFRPSHPPVSAHPLPPCARWCPRLGAARRPPARAAGHGQDGGRASRGACPLDPTALADQAVAVDMVEVISHETVRHAFKQMR